MTRCRGMPGAACLTLAVTVVVLTTTAPDSGASHGRTSPAVPRALTVSVGAPSPPTRSTCALNPATDAITGAYGSASEIGWAGDDSGVVTCLGGSFYVQGGLNRAFGFGIYDGGPTSWKDADGYLPAQITTFHHQGALVSITEFADRVTIGAEPYVAVYARVAIANPTDSALLANPEAAPGLVALAAAPGTVAAHGSVVHDYVMAVDRSDSRAPWPPAGALVAAGSFDRHFAHMRAFWNDQLSQIAQVRLPDQQLTDAYRSGFIYTQIARSGTHLNTGVNGYQAEYSHDVIGILANLFTQGYDDNAHGLLLEARQVVGSQGQYPDGLWTYPWPWAVYLLKTGDLAFVREHFSTPGPGGSAQPSIEEAAHHIASDRTGPGGIIGVTNDVDADGYWTVDDYEALTGLAAYRYLAQRVGDPAQVRWASDEYASLLSATNATLTGTIAHGHLNYLPCSMTEANAANRCANPADANWAAPFLFGRWAWDAGLFGAAVNGPGLGLIDATYDYGFGRLRGLLPPDTFGGYPSDYYSTAYNAGYGAWGLASSRYRDQGILGYEFMVAHSQSGPYSWWESASDPPTASPWIGTHPASGQGSSPHAWGIANANMVLLDSLVTQAADGVLIVGRGIPDAWLASGGSISVRDFPTADGRRTTVGIFSRSHQVTLTLRGSLTTGPVLFQLPLFVNNIAASSAGRIDQRTGTVRLSAGANGVTVRLRHGPA